VISKKREGNLQCRLYYYSSIVRSFCKTLQRTKDKIGDCNNASPSFQAGGSGCKVPSSLSVCMRGGKKAKDTL